MKSKNKKKFFLLFLFSSIFFIGCSSTVDNSISFLNSSSSQITINFRGNDITVAVGEKKEIQEITKGTYTYATTFVIPVGANSVSTSGDISGQVTLKAGTKILVIYSSTLINGDYTLFATISNSDDQSSPTSP